MSFGDTQKPAINLPQELYTSVQKTADEIRIAIVQDLSNIGAVCDLLADEERQGQTVDRGKAALVMALTHMLADIFDKSGDDGLKTFTPLKDTLKRLSAGQKFTILSGISKAALVEEPILVPAAVAERTAFRQTLAMLVSL